MTIRLDHRRRVIAFDDKGGSKRERVAAARDEKDYRAAMLRERAESFAAHVKSELLALRKLKRIKTIA